uniref:Fucoxanthin-chlorophyll a/c light-harvesting protein n=1 Tax=Thalassionema nitzschioides TaxID=33649 RepID=A0A6T5XZA6_9STRA|mmetsp:Transcript_7243/g.6011  ORF Transcript_7243/g.6011 Transcript_7243/m.6011 type:complete len:206 (+) Transcript_7243:1-618(+)|eukprot:CAMPEP_0194199474 /NCGR_PEP_ID=MMETSP0156-20130528/475_1 /TAXON_ID=33649 /ORGANISM="Thalassionema nitzschioides, Strain L26-B" /LENGTH=205 /DNA_ID=CAMNT_0038924367 /DNA_START=31 /DNA_END=648 /DNA_ORIENTATION=-
MKTTLLSIIVASAAAFSSTKTSSKSSSLLASFENEVGAQRPLGFWDPLNLVLNEDQERFDRLRYVELKHGRIAMLAVAGHIWTTAGNRLPGDIDYSGTSFASIKVGLGGISDIPQSGLVQIIAFIGFLELFVMKDRTGDGEFPGDFRNGGDYGWGKLSDDVKMQKRSIELNNGRAAQMGILGLMVHEKLTGEPYVINSLLGYHTN